MSAAPSAAGSLVMGGAARMVLSREALNTTLGQGGFVTLLMKAEAEALVRGLDVV